MSQYRVLRRLVVVATLGALAMGGCFSADDDDGDGDDGGGSDGKAVMKFCNGLVLTDPTTGGSVDVELTVVFAGVEATAMSGTCTPVVPNACIPVPAGDNPSVVLEDPSTSPATEIISGTFPTLTVDDGAELYVLATVDDVSGEPTVEAGTFNADFSCAETDPFAEMLETRSAPVAARAQRSLHTQPNPAATRFLRKALPLGIGR